MARLVGINHVALEVGDVDEALAWYGRFFDVELRGRWGNNVQVVDYREIQFTKAPEIARGMGIDDLEKTDKALDELRAKGLAG